MNEFTSQILTSVLVSFSLLSSSCTPVNQTATSGELTVHYIDVGQADSALVQCDGENMLIDGGNVGDSSLIVSYLQDCGVETIDYLVCTHAHEDHCGGLSGALNKFDVERVFAPQTESEAKFYKNFQDAVYAQNIEIENPNVGDTFNVGTSDVIILGPENEDTEDLNNTSIVLKLIFGETSFMFTGDAEQEEEADVVASGYDLSADVLKVGHHGAKTSSSYVFLREVMPKYAVISVGKDNSYSHPTEEALSRLRDAGAEVYRTDMQGHIVAKSDGKNITFETKKNSDIETNPTVSEENTSQSYIGNKNSKKLHKPDCASLPKEENREYFSSLEEAFNDGYSQCKSCFK